MADGLDPVPVRVEQESGAVVRVVGGAQARLPSQRLPEASPAAWKASTAARLGARKHQCRLSATRAGPALTQTDK